MALNPKVIREVKVSFADLVYDNYLKEMYSLSACKSDYSEAKMEELRLLMGLKESCVECPKGKPKIDSAKSTPYQPLTVVQTTGRKLLMTWVQSNPAGTWVVTHSLDCKPTVEVQDNFGNPIPGQIKYLDNNTLQILFQSIVGGKAYLYS